MEPLPPISGQSHLSSLLTQDPLPTSTRKSDQNESTIPPSDFFIEGISDFIRKFINLFRENKPSIEKKEPQQDEKKLLLPKIFSEEIKKVEMIDKYLEVKEPFQSFFEGKKILGISLQSELLTSTLPIPFLHELLKQVEGNFLVAFQEKTEEIELHFYAKDFNPTFLTKYPCYFYRVGEEDGRSFLLFKNRVTP